MRPKESHPIIDECGVLLCPHCGENEWHVEKQHILRCASCQATLPIEHNIVDCVQATSSLSPSATEWSAFYVHSLKPYSPGADWWRLLCWEKYLFGGVIQNSAGKLIIDFGCGTAFRVAALAPIQAHAYRYVGIDSSLDALKRATQALPGAYFVHADVGSLRLQPERADIVLCLGLLMYFQDFKQLLSRFIHTLKPGGILLLHEQICRKSWGSSHAIYPVSQGIPLKELKECLAEQGSTIRIHLTGSPLRRLFIKILNNTSLHLFRPFALWTDSLWCKTIGRALPLMGASEVQIVFQKA